MGAERIVEEIPGRLEEALKYAVGRIEDDPKTIEAIVRYLGWDGHDVNQHRRDEPADFARGHTRQLVDYAIGRLQEEQFVPAAVERALSLIESSIPILDSELWEAFLKARLCFIRLSCDALVSVAAVFREESRFERVRFGRNDGLVKSGSAEGIGRLAGRAQALMQSHGWANIVTLTDDAREIFGPMVSQKFIEAVVRTVPRFEWLDEKSASFWYMPDRDDGSSNRLVSQIKRVLAAVPRVRLAELRSGIRSSNQAAGIAPPLSVLASICRRALFAHLEEDVVVRDYGSVGWDDILDPNEAILISILQSHGPALGRDAFLEFCRERAVNEETFDRLTSGSEILIRRSEAYALVGTTKPAGKIEGVDAGATDELSASASQLDLSEGRVSLRWKLQSATVQGGVLRVPEPANTFLEGDYTLSTVSGREIGRIQIRQRACWDVRRLLHYAGGDAGDSLVIEFDLRSRRAVGTLGD
jgi:hypothetical protein